MSNAVHSSKKSVFKQTGAATLIVAIVLLLAVTIAAFSAARIGVGEQRTSVNQMRANTAFEVAQAGVEYGVSYLGANNPEITSAPPAAPGGWVNTGPQARWIACTAADTVLPCGDGSNNIYRDGTANTPLPGNWLWYTVPAGSLIQTNPAYTYTLHYLTPCFGGCAGATPTPAVNPTVIVVAEASSLTADTLAGRAVARQIVRSYPSLARIPDATIVTAGTIGTTGNMNIWGAPVGILSNTPGVNNPNVLAPTPYNPNLPDGFSFTPPTTGTAFNTTQNNGNNYPAGTTTASFTASVTQRFTTGNTTATTVTIGTPLSIWARETTSNGLPDEVPMGGSAATCRNIPQTPPVANNACDDFTLSTSGNVPTTPFQYSYNDPNMTWRDILVGSRVTSYNSSGLTTCTPFPGTLPPYPLASPTGLCSSTNPPSPDMFSYVFGMPDSQSNTIRRRANIISSCANLGTSANPPGLYWVTGGCTIGAGMVIGSSISPYLVVVDGNTLQMNGGAEFFGLIYVRGGNILLNGNNTMFGALVADSGTLNIAGNFKAIYDANVLNRVNHQTGGFGKLGGGWLDRP